MADLKISQLPGATTPLAGTEVLPIVQSGTTKKATIANIVGAGTSAGSFTGVTSTAPVGVVSQTSAGSSGYVQLSGTANYRVFGGPFIGGTVVEAAAGGVYTKVAGAITTATTSNGLEVSTGNLVIGTSGKGIDFSATASGSGTMTSELLADYEEGTWTPVVAGSTSAGSVVYAVQVANYTKIGNRVFFNLQVQLNGAHSGTGNILITGLPYTCNATYGSAITQYANSLNSGVVTALQFLIYQGESQIRLARYAAGAASVLPMSNLNTDSNIYVSGSYIV